MPTHNCSPGFRALCVRKSNMCLFHSSDLRFQEFSMLRARHCNAEFLNCVSLQSAAECYVAKGMNCRTPRTSCARLVCMCQPQVHQLRQALKMMKRLSGTPRAIQPQRFKRVKQRMVGNDKGNHDTLEECVVINFSEDCC